MSEKEIKRLFVIVRSELENPDGPSKEGAKAIADLLEGALLNLARIANRPG